jgi:hypothetical protein
MTEEMVGVQDRSDDATQTEREGEQTKQRSQVWFFRTERIGVSRR